MTAESRIPEVKPHLILGELKKCFVCNMERERSLQVHCTACGNCFCFGFLNHWKSKLHKCNPRDVKYVSPLYFNEFTPQEAEEHSMMFEFPERNSLEKNKELLHYFVFSDVITYELKRRLERNAPTQYQGYLNSLKHVKEFGLWNSGAKPPQTFTMNLGGKKNVLDMYMKVGQRPATCYTKHDIYCDGQFVKSHAGITTAGQVIVSNINRIAETIEIKTVQSESWVAWEGVKVEYNHEGVSDCCDNKSKL